MGSGLVIWAIISVLVLVVGVSRVLQGRRRRAERRNVPRVRSSRDSRGRGRR